MTTKQLADRLQKYGHADEAAVIRSMDNLLQKRWSDMCELSERVFSLEETIRQGLAALDAVQAYVEDAKNHETQSGYTLGIISAKLAAAREFLKEAA